MLRFPFCSQERPEKLTTSLEDEAEAENIIAGVRLVGVAESGAAELRKVAPAAAANHAGDAGIRPLRIRYGSLRLALLIIISLKPNGLMADLYFIFCRAPGRARGIVHARRSHRASGSWRNGCVNAGGKDTQGFAFEAYGG